MIVDMKIGFEAKRAFTNTTGLGYYARILTSSLAKKFCGDSYILFTPKKTDLFNTSSYTNMQVVTPQSFTGKLLSSYWRSNGVRKDIVAMDIDLYHGLSHEIPYNIHKLRKVKTVVTMHDLIIERYPEQYNPIDVKTYRFKYKYSCYHADKILTVSKQTKQDLVDFYKIPEERIEVCYPSSMEYFVKKVCDTEKQRIKALYNLPDQFFLSVGSIIPRKNLLMICKAFCELKNVINIPLVVIGKGRRYKEEVKQYLTDNGLTDRVIFLNDTPQAKTSRRFATGEDFPAIYQQALCMIYPSMFEGFGLPVLEALQSGLPVITSNCSCLTETAGNAAYYIDPLSVTEMAGAIATIAADDTIRNEMIERGYEHAKLFLQEKCAEKVMHAYTSLF